MLWQVSDCDAINDAATHAYIVRQFNGSLQVQAQQAIRGGTDLNCGALYGACTGNCSASARLTWPPARVLPCSTQLRGGASRPR